MKFFKKIISFIIVVTITVIFIACSSDDNGSTTNPTTPTNPSGNMTKIMPLGASRVAGARPLYESYRYELWKLLLDGNYNFDFIGTETDPADYPLYNDQSFDRDHEGRGGISSGGILAELEIWLNDLANVPDIVLFSSPGGNDGFTNLNQTVSNINAIIDIFQARNPNVTIFLELPAPALTSEQTPEFLAFYNQALATLPQVAMNKTTTTSSVLTVDMSTNFIDAYLADDVHYSEAGAVFIANRYLEVLMPLLQ